MSTPLKVCSYMRSGTHFLMAAIYMNFDINDVSGPSTPKPADDVIFQIDAVEKNTIPWDKLFLSHSHPDEVGDLKNCIYIYRNPFDTLASLHKLIGSAEPVSTFILHRLGDWYKHVEGYRKKCVCVSYESLCNNFNFEIARIGNIFNLKRKSNEIVRPPIVGWKRSN